MARRTFESNDRSASDAAAGGSALHNASMRSSAWSLSLNNSPNACTSSVAIPAALCAVESCPSFVCSVEDAGGCPVMPKTPDTPRDSLNVGKHLVGLRKDEVVDINENRH